MAEEKNNSMEQSQFEEMSESEKELGSWISQHLERLA